MHQPWLWVVVVNQKGCTRAGPFNRGRAVRPLEHTEASGPGHREFIHAPENAVNGTPLTNCFEGVTHINHSEEPKVVSTDKYSGQ
jgi:hypothetical protein